MARSKTPASPHAPSKQLTPSEIEKGLARLRTRLAELEAFDPSGIRETRPPELVALSTGIEAALSKTFGDKTSEYYRYLDASDLLWSPAIFIGGYETPLSDYRDAMTNRVKNARILLKEAIRSLEEDLADGPPVAPAKAAQSAPALSKRVFVVRALLMKAGEAGGLTARGWTRTLRLARTIADLDGADGVLRRHVAEALIYRRAGLAAQGDFERRQAHRTGAF